MKRAVRIGFLISILILVLHTTILYGAFPANVESNINYWGWAGLFFFGSASWVVGGDPVRRSIHVGVVIVILFLVLGANGFSSRNLEALVFPIAGIGAGLIASSQRKESSKA